MAQMPLCQCEKSRANGAAKSPAVPRTGPSLADVCAELRRKVTGFLAEKTEDKMLRGVQGQVRTSMAVIEEALARYGPEQLSLSYNGGKDCLVLLVLILACLPVWTTPSAPNGTSQPHPSSNDTKNSTTTSSTDQTAHRPSSNGETEAPAPRTLPDKIQAVYVVSPHPFPEVEDFVETTAQKYYLDLKRYDLPMKPALEAYLGERKAVRAVFVGTRRTDPHGELLTHFDPTDGDWPQFMRVHPVIDWHYAEVWAFIRHLNIPFCELYNRGFTSLGGMTDTHRNPALALDESGTKFRPAYELMDDEEERLGRDR